MTDYTEARTTEHEIGQGQRVASFQATQMIWLLLGLLEAMILLRVVFKLIPVNAANSFAALLYSVTNLFIAPFTSLTAAPAAGGRVLEISSIIAMMVYFLIAWGIKRIVYLLFLRPRGPVSTRETIVTDHTPLQAPMGVSQTMTTDQITTQSPLSASQTTITERTSTASPAEV